jgi:bifunctional DNA-binding transcriptional regulator/antitoxin component of YhaV-PrlF toxin-antitoxin module
MGYISKVQVIQRANKNRQYYLICPAPMAQALEIEKGETIEWVIEDKHTLILKRFISDENGRRSSLHGK